MSFVPHIAGNKSAITPALGPAAKPQRSGIKRVASVHRRKRVSALSGDERKRITFLFDHSRGDADYVADRCGVIGIQRADVLAVVLMDMRRNGPGWDQSPVRRIA